MCITAPDTHETSQVDRWEEWFQFSSPSSICSSYAYPFGYLESSFDDYNTEYNVTVVYMVIILYNLRENDKRKAKLDEYNHSVS